MVRHAREILVDYNALTRARAHAARSKRHARDGTRSSVGGAPSLLVLELPSSTMS